MDTSLTQRPRLRFSPPYPCCSIRPPRRRVDISAAVAAYLARALFPGQIAAETGPGTCGSTAWMTLPQSPTGRVSRKLSQLHGDACSPARPGPSRPVKRPSSALGDVAERLERRCFKHGQKQAARQRQPPRCIGSGPTFHTSWPLCSRSE